MSATTSAPAPSGDPKAAHSDFVYPSTSARHVGYIRHAAIPLPSATATRPPERFTARAIPMSSSTAALTGPESAPHTHVMTAPSGAPVPVGGLSSTAGGYSFVVTGMSPFTFHIQGPDGHPVTKFQLVHEKPLHLIVVRKDLSGYQHVHPTMAADGTWTVALSLPVPGPYRAYADFTTGNGTAVVLGTDLPAAVGAAASVAPPSTVDTAFTVTHEGTLTVSRRKVNLHPNFGAVDDETVAILVCDVRMRRVLWPNHLEEIP